MAPGSSLGGARPKASVVDPDNGLWIAKFPGKSDEYDMSAWEMLAHILAQRSGIHCSESRLESLSSRGLTFLTKRFDRPSPGKRLHFTSAMTLLGYTDGTDSASGASYLNLVDFIIRQGARPDEDLIELWRRIVFNIAISNTDDHLRNHGFMLKNQGWVLSPAFDLNPCPYGHGLSLSVNENDNSLDFDLAKSVAPYFRLSASQSKEILAQVTDAVSQWVSIAKNIGISPSERNQMAPAFASVSKFN